MEKRGAGNEDEHTYTTDHGRREPLGMHRIQLLYPPETSRKSKESVVRDDNGLGKFQHKDTIHDAFYE